MSVIFVTTFKMMIPFLILTLLILLCISTASLTEPYALERLIERGVVPGEKTENYVSSTFQVEKWNKLGVALLALRCVTSATNLVLGERLNIPYGIKEWLPISSPTGTIYGIELHNSSDIPIYAFHSVGKEWSPSLSKKEIGKNLITAFGFIEEKLKGGKTVLVTGYGYGAVLAQMAAISLKQGGSEVIYHGFSVPPMDEEHNAIFTKNINKRCVWKTKDKMANYFKWFH